jgi:hypothetical protein
MTIKREEKDEEVEVPVARLLIQYLLAACTVTVGLRLLLYSHTTTRSLLQAYMHMDKAISVPGDVLSCEEVSIHPDKFDWPSCSRSSCKSIVVVLVL